MNNTNNPNTEALYYAGYNGISPLLAELRDAYVFAGLLPDNALEAAFADFADLLRSVA